MPREREVRDMELGREHIVAICADDTLRSKMSSDPQAAGLLARPLGQLSDAELGELHDLALDAWRNEAPVVEHHTAEQDLGPYAVLISGVPGAYFVSATEFDDEGPFDRLEAARDAMAFHYGEFLTPQRDAGQI